MVKLVMELHHGIFKVMEVVMKLHYGNSRKVRLVLSPHHMDFCTCVSRWVANFTKGLVSSKMKWMLLIKDIISLPLLW